MGTQFVRKAVAGIASVSLLTIAVTATAETVPDLWNDAVRIHARNQDWEAGLVRVSFVQYNRRDQEISRSRSLIQVTVGEDGELVSTVIESHHDGEAGDEQSEGGAPFGSEENAFEVLQISPFDPTEQRRVRVQQTEEIRYIDGHRAVAFEYTVSGDGNRSAVGTAWLSEESGRPLMLEATIDPLPRYLESFSARQRYSGDSERWTAESLDFDADIRFLLIRRRIETAMEFSDYFEYRE